MRARWVHCTSPNYFAPGERNRAPVDVEGWRQRLLEADPDLIAQIDGTVRTLAVLVPQVVRAMERVGPLTSRFCVLFHLLHPGGPRADSDREQVEDHVGVEALWQLCDKVRDSHPEGG